MCFTCGRALFGLTRATDVVGGLRAWREAGLPLAEAAAA